jgi:hypothetical protein
VCQVLVKLVPQAEPHAGAQSKRNIPKPQGEGCLGRHDFSCTISQIITVFASDEGGEAALGSGSGSLPFPLALLSQPVSCQHSFRQKLCAAPEADVIMT